MSNFLPQTYQTVTGYHDMQPHLEDIPLQAPGKNQILIKMVFAPINQTDLINLSDNSRISVNPPYPVGIEGSGTIAAVGEDLQVAYKVGDRVHVHSNETLAQYCLAFSEDCPFIKGDLSFEEAAPFVINPSTLISVVRQDKHFDELKKEGADYVLNSESSDFEEKLKDIAAQEGATIIFDAINGNFTADKLLKNMPAGSICYAYGMLSGDHKWKGWDTKKYQFEDEKFITGLVYTTYINELKEKEQLDKLWTEIHGSLKTIFRTNVKKIYPLDEIHEAVEYYKANSSQGKILIKLN